MTAEDKPYRKVAALLDAVRDAIERALPDEDVVAMVVSNRDFDELKRAYTAVIDIGNFRVTK